MSPIERRRTVITSEPSVPLNDRILQGIKDQIAGFRAKLPTEDSRHAVPALEAALREAMPIHMERSSEDYMEFRWSILRRIISERLRPVDVARMLEPARERWPFLAMSFADEIDVLNQLGEHWGQDKELASC